MLQSYEDGNDLTYVSISPLLNNKLHHLQHLFLSFFVNQLDYNSIGSKGCKLLSKGQWQFLKILSLGSSYLI